MDEIEEVELLEDEEFNVDIYPPDEYTGPTYWEFEDIGPN